MVARVVAGGLLLALLTGLALAQFTVPPPSTGAIKSGLAPGATAPPIAGAVPAASPPAAAPPAVPTTIPTMPIPGAAAPATASPVAGPPAASVAPPTNPTPAAAPSAAATSPAPAAPRGPITRVTTITAGLSSDKGQVWKEYDISPYTARVSGVTRPEQAIVDWILRETGTEFWFTPPLGFLNADNRTLRVYHTPEVHQLVQDVVDRFNSNLADPLAVQLRLVTIGNPNWRVKAQRMLRPVKVQTPGVEAWLLNREEAAILLADAHKRTDYRELVSPQISVNNGQTATFAAQQKRSYIRGYRAQGNVWQEPETTELPEGFSLEVSPLLSVDKRTLDAVVRCRVDQIERLTSVPVDITSPTAAVQRVQLQVPQTAHWSLQERFRWPAEQVLLVSVGVVPTPSADKQTRLGIVSPLDLSSPRAETLIVVDYRGGLSPALPPGVVPTAAGAGLTPAAREAMPGFKPRY